MVRAETILLAGAMKVLIKVSHGVRGRVLRGETKNTNRYGLYNCAYKNFQWSTFGFCYMGIVTFEIKRSLNQLVARSHEHVISNHWKWPELKQFCWPGPVKWS